MKLVEKFNKLSPTRKAAVVAITAVPVRSR
jgi:hypothetical protein